MPTPPMHNHLDRSIRPRGTDCPGCEHFWAAQDARLAATRANTAERQIANLTQKEADRWTELDWCIALGEVPAIDDLCDLHTCDKLRAHAPPHHCPTCDRTWTTKKTKRR